MSIDISSLSFAICHTQKLCVARACTGEGPNINQSILQIFDQTISWNILSKVYSNILSNYISPIVHSSLRLLLCGHSNGCVDVLSWTPWTPVRQAVAKLFTDQFFSPFLQFIQPHFPYFVDNHYHQLYQLFLNSEGSGQNKNNHQNPISRRSQ